MNWERWLKYLILSGLFAVLFTPLIVADSLFFPFITGKAFAFRVITEIIFGAWLLLAIFNPQYRPRRTALIIASAVFFLIATLATIFSADPYRSFWSNFERMEGLVSYLHLFAYFLVLTSVFQSEKIWRWYFQTSLLVSVLVAAYGVAQLLGKAEIHQGGIRLDATLGNAVYLAVYMLFHIFIAAWLWATAERRYWDFIYGPAIALQAAILYYTATRGTILGLLGGALVMLLAFTVLSRAQSRLRKAAIGGVVLVAVFIGAFWLARDTDFVQKSRVLSRFANISPSETTTESRLTIWRMALRGVAERPILGWGPENFNLIFNKYYEPKLWRQEAWFDRAHNIYLDWLSNAGVLGLISYLSLYILALWLLWRRESDIKVKGIFTGFLAGYAFQNIFIFDNLTSYLLFFAVLGYINFRTSKPRQIAAANGNLGLSMKLGLTVVVVAAAVTGVMYFLTLRPLQANAALIRAMTSGKADEQLARFQKVFDHETFGSTEASEQFAQSALRVLNQRDIPDEFKQTYALATLSELKKTIERSPLDARHYLFLGTFARAVGDRQTALTAFSEAIALSPRKQHIYFELVNTYLALGSLDKALELAEKVYRLDSEYDEARYYYALVLIRNRQIAAAGALLKEDADWLDERFINAYVDVGEYQKALRLWQKHVERKPNDVQLRFNLAAAYLAVGQRLKSIAELEEAIKIDPRVKEQAEALISEIRAGRNPLER